MEKSRFQVAKLVQCRQIRKSAGIIDSLDLYDIFIISASSRHCKKISKLIFSQYTRLALYLYHG